MFKANTILILILVFYVCYCQEEMLFYKELKKYCKKNNGNCSSCTCWSCPRKLYNDEYMTQKNKKVG